MHCRHSCPCRRRPPAAAAPPLGSSEAGYTPPSPQRACRWPSPSPSPSRCRFWPVRGSSAPPAAPPRLSAAATRGILARPAYFRRQLCSRKAPSFFSDRSSSASALRPRERSQSSPASAWRLGEGRNKWRLENERARSGDSSESYRHERQTKYPCVCSITTLMPRQRRRSQFHELV